MKASLPLGRRHLRRHFGGEIVDLLLDALADDVQREAAHARGLSLEARQADLFDLAPELFGAFDLVVEHTCFCAIERHRRPEYAAVVSRMVRPGGHFVGVFYWLTPEGGPPFSSTAADQHALFSPTFEILRLEPNPFSHARRAGKEGWGVFRRLGR